MLVTVSRRRPAEAHLDEKADSPDGTQGVGYAGRSNSTDRATLLQVDLSGRRNNRSMADQGRPGLFIASQESQASHTGRENTRMQSNTWVHVTKLKPPVTLLGDTEG